MRAKTLVVKRRSSNSIPRSNASVTSPLVCQDEDNEECHVHGNGESEDTGSSEDNDDNNDDAVDKYDDFDDVNEEGDGTGNGRGNAAGDNDLAPDEDDNDLTPDFVEGVGESTGVKCILSDWLGVFSYSCSGGNSRVLVCCENGCPIALHELCMNTKPVFDDKGKFYCAYCWYKREVARTEELRREVLLAKIKLLKFIRFKRDGGNEDGADNMKANSLSTTATGRNSGDGENALNDDASETIYYTQEQIVCVVSQGKKKSDDKSTSKAHGSDNVAYGQVMQGVSEDNQRKSGEEEPVLPDAATLVDSPKSPSLEPCTSAEDKKTNLQGKATTSENSVQYQELNKQM